MVKYLSMPSYPIQMIRKKKKKMSFQMSSIVYLFKKWDKESWNNRKKHSESCRTSLYKTFCCYVFPEKKKNPIFFEYLFKMNDTDLQAILSVASSIHSMKQNINCLLIVYHLTFDLRMDSGFEIPESRRLEVQMEMNQLIRTREL